MHVEPPASFVSPSPPVVGDAAPNFVVPAAGGGTTRLSELRGAPIVIVFHSPEWDPARGEQIEGYRRRAAMRSTDDVAPPLLIRNDHPSAHLFGIAGRLAVFVLDDEGVVAWRHIAGIDALDGFDASDAPAEFAVAAEALCEDEPVRVRGGLGHSGAWTRRDFVATVLGAAIVLALDPRFTRAEPVRPTTGIGDPRPVTLNVNGRALTLTLEPRVTLLDALREYAGLTGSKKGCDHGQCGACTVHIDGRRVLSCLAFAVMQQGKQITTIEGLAPAAAGGGALHPMQQAFIEHDGFQCGYCTSGQIMSAVAMVREPWGPSDDDVREAMSGNICRCGAYPGIVAAVQDVRHAGGGQGGPR